MGQIRKLARGTQPQAWLFVREGAPDGDAMRSERARERVAPWSRAASCSLRSRTRSSLRRDISGPRRAMHARITTSLGKGHSPDADDGFQRKMVHPAQRLVVLPLLHAFCAQARRANLEHRLVLGRAPRMETRRSLSVHP